jgi:Tetratricopeptide repeat
MGEPGADARSMPGGDSALPEVRQTVSGTGTARQAVLGAGTQFVFFSGPVPEPEMAVSIAPPLGQLSAGLPMRGREEMLRELSGPGLRVRVLYGLGGCGKTRLALEAAAEAVRGGTEVWWVSGAGAGVLEAGMRAVGRRLGVTDGELGHGDAADVIWQRLAARQRKWLLVIDNADDPQLLAGAGANVGDGQGWLRPVPRSAGMILVTSRDGRAASWGPWCARLRLPVLSGEQAALMVSDYAGRDRGLGSVADARELAVRLGGLPLAAKIAGSYLADAAATPAAYADAGMIRTYRQYREAIDSRDRAVFPAPAGGLTEAQARGLIGWTWELTLDLLQARQMPEARTVLRLLASFADAPVPHELLLDPGMLSVSALLPGLTGSRLWEVLQVLDGSGLVDLDASGDGVGAIAIARLHPLVRDTSLPPAVQRPVFLALAARLLRHAAAAAEETGEPEDPRTWRVWQHLAPHCIAVFAGLTAEPDCPNDAAEAAAYAAQTALRYQAKEGFRAESEAVLHDVLAVRLRLLGPDHSDTLLTRQFIAWVLTMHHGKHAQAEAEYRDVLAIRLRQLGPDHPDTLTSRHCVAFVVAAQGDHAGAEAEFRAVLAAGQRVLGPDHPDMLITRHCIATEMAARDDHAGAEAVFRDVLAARERVLGPDHPDALANRHCIATEIGAQGDHARAEAEYRDVLAAQERVLGPDHPATRATAACVNLLRPRNRT